MKIFKKSIALLLISFVILLLSHCKNKKDSKNTQLIQEKKVLLATEKAPKVALEKLKKKAIEAKIYCENKKLNTDYCILIDMSLHSGVKRFFVWDYKKDSIQYSFLVSHGCCDGDWATDNSKENPVFSNIENSHCSSLGKYKLGKRAYSDWGIHVKYFMHGLEKTNNNALSRMIVFHSWDTISDEETFPVGIPEGWGCPAISNTNMKIIDLQLQKTTKPVLMWIYTV